MAMTSANAAGEPPLPSAAAVAETLGHAVDLVLDGGEPRLGEASGVLDLGPGRFELLREGLLPIEDLRRTAGLRIAFACTGNTCRSPMAEGLLKKQLADHIGCAVDKIDGEGFRVVSAGTYAVDGAPATPEAVEAMAELGIDIQSHRLVYYNGFG